LQVSINTMHIMASRDRMVMQYGYKCKCLHLLMASLSISMNTLYTKTSHVNQILHGCVNRHTLL
jgi:hypothetical protein